MASTSMAESQRRTEKQLVRASFSKASVVSEPIVRVSEAPDTKESVEPALVLLLGVSRVVLRRSPASGLGGDLLQHLMKPFALDVVLLVASGNGLEVLTSTQDGESPTGLESDVD